MAVILLVWAPNNGTIFDDMGKRESVCIDRPTSALQRPPCGYCVSDTGALEEFEGLTGIGRNFGLGVKQGAIKIEYNECQNTAPPVRGLSVAQSIRAWRPEPLDMRVLVRVRSI